MSALTDALTAYGADVQSALERFGGDESLYQLCFGLLLDDQNFHDLEAHIAAENMEGAFLAAHTLKGVLGNLGITPLLHSISNVVEALRTHDTENLSTEHEAIHAGLAQLRQIQMETASPA